MISLFTLSRNCFHTILYYPNCLNPRSSSSKMVSRWISQAFELCKSLSGKGWDDFLNFSCKCLYFEISLTSWSHSKLPDFEMAKHFFVANTLCVVLPSWVCSSMSWLNKVFISKEFLSCFFLEGEKNSDHPPSNCYLLYDVGASYGTRCSTIFEAIDLYSRCSLFLLHW